MINFILLMIFLFFAHLVGDVLVRPPIVHKFKSRSNLVMIFHCYIYASIVCFVVLLLPKCLIEWSTTEFLFKFVFLFMGHFLIDKFVATRNVYKNWVDEDGRNIQVSKWNYIDQGLHFLQLLFVGLF